MDFSFTQEQEAYRQKIRDFAEKAGLDRGLSELDRNGEFNRRGWDLCAEFGIHGGLIPKEYGGQGLDLITYVAGLEMLGEFCRDNGLLFAIGAHVFACELPLLAYGNDEQKKRWLPALCSGKKVAAIAIAEEHGASDAFDIRTTAIIDGGEYALNGSKCYVTNAPFCDLVFVFATFDGDPGSIICLVVENGIPGMQRDCATDKMGLRTGPFGSLVFKNCRIPAGNILGKPSSGKMVFMSAMEWERGCLLAPMVGTMQRQLLECVKRVKTRSQRGDELSKHQVLRHRIAEMKVRTEAARLLLYNFAWKKQTTRRANMEASIAKLFVSEAFAKNSLDALQIHAAYGYTVNSGVERELRDAIGTTIASGTSDIQRNIIAKWLKL